MSSDSNHQSVPKIQAEMQSPNDEMRPSPWNGFSLGGIPLSSNTSKKLTEDAAEEANRLQVQTKRDMLKNAMVNTAAAAGRDGDVAGQQNGSTATSKAHTLSNGIKQKREEQGGESNPMDSIEEILALSSAMAGHVHFSASQSVGDDEENKSRQDNKGKSSSPSPHGQGD